MLLLRRERISIDFGVDTHDWNNPIWVGDNNFANRMATDLLIGFNNTLAVNGTERLLTVEGWSSIGDMIEDTVSPVPSCRLSTYFQSSSALAQQRELEGSGGNDYLGVCVTDNIITASKPLCFGAFRFWMQTDATLGKYDIAIEFWNRYLERGK